MRWKYLVIIESMNSCSLNELETYGWELAALVSPSHFVLHHFFRRGVKA